ncbi:MAG: hypothetical protein B7Z05_02940 [Thiotrichales bacterium 32-46-8]|nr:MAG: hypothetical protein B7Z05_02940 [Thiotrichales bacterium 32-46-8]
MRFVTICPYDLKKEKKDFQLLIANASIAFLITFLIIFPWYSGNFTNVFSIGTQALKGEESDPQLLFSLQNIFYYFLLSYII